MNLVVQMQRNHLSVATWALLLGQHMVHLAEQRIGEKEGLGYSIQLHREEPSADKVADVLCVGQDHEVICKCDCSGDSRG